MKLLRLALAAAALAVTAACAADVTGPDASRSALEEPSAERAGWTGATGSGS